MQYANKSFKAKKAPLIRDGAILFVSDEEWAACPGCAVLIESNRPVELLDLAVSISTEAFHLTPVEVANARKNISERHGLYWGNRAA